MKSIIEIPVRRFPVIVYDKRSTVELPLAENVTLSKQQLQAAMVCGLSSNEVITRICEKKGYKVLEIGTPDKVTLTVDLDALAWKELEG